MYPELGPKCTQIGAPHEQKTGARNAPQKGTKTSTRKAQKPFVFLVFPLKRAPRRDPQKDSKMSQKRAPLSAKRGPKNGLRNVPGARSALGKFLRYLGIWLPWRRNRSKIMIDCIMCTYFLLAQPRID